MLFNTAIPRESQDTVERELEPGEQIHWIDMPRPAFFTVGSTVLFAFGIAWTAFTLFWTISAFHENPGLGRSNVFFAMLGLPFVLVGLALLLTPIWAYWGDLRTVYAITDRRAIVFRRGWSTIILSFSPGQLQNVCRVEKGSDFGTVVLGRRKWPDPSGSLRQEDVGFERIARPREVEAMLKRLAEQAVPPQG
jgi:hypothetical protein